MEPVAKDFVLTHVIDYSSFRKNCFRDVFSNAVDHFNVPWRLVIGSRDDYLTFFVECVRPEVVGEWAVHAQIDGKLISLSGNQFIKTFTDVKFGTSNASFRNGTSEMMKIWPVEREYVSNDQLIVEAHVVISKMTGIEKKKKLMVFDNARCDQSDVVLSVNHEKFHVSKVFMASHSSYFNSLFFKNFEESQKELVPLNKIDPEVFQTFLELLFLKPALTNSHVKEVLALADMYDTAGVTHLCEEFLVTKSTDSLKNKLVIALKFKLRKLKNHVLENIKSRVELRAAIGSELKQINMAVYMDLLEKCLTLP